MKWIAGLYGRVSTDHEEQQESINVQREALVNYAKTNGYDIVGYYFDEGYSGTNFERPEIKRLKDDIVKNKINIVIVKDLSRIGRNNPLTLLFLEYLTENGIRLVSVSDGYDSFKDEDDIIGIKTWINERYSKELSQKIKFALKHKKNKGEYLAAFAPYGYRKSDLIKNKLVIDPYAAGIVREIFDLYINGFGFSKIADILQERGILNPSSYGVYSKRGERWDWTTIKKIISNTVYLGHSIQNKCRKKSYKSKDIIKVPEKEWIVVKNTHEGIIDENTFNIAQQVLSGRRSYSSYRCGSNGPHLFSSFLFCHECGKPLYYKKVDNISLYRCGGYVKFGRKYCSSHQIIEKEMESILANEIKKVINAHINYSDLANEIYNGYLTTDQSTSELGIIEREINKNKTKIETMYKDRLEGIINISLYERLASDCQKIISGLEIRKNQLLSLNNCTVQCDQLISKLIYKIIDMLQFKDGIDREVLEVFIKRIEICEDKTVTIEFNFFIS